MGYLNRSIPAGLLSGNPPQLSPFEGDTHKEHRLLGVFLGTVAAVPSFRASILTAAGLRGGLFNQKADVLQDVQFVEANELIDRSHPADGFIRARGLFGAANVVVEANSHAFSAENETDVKRVVYGLEHAKSHKIQRVIGIANTAAPAAFVDQIAARLSAPLGDRFRSITWMMTVDIAYNLLSRRRVRSAAERFLLEQYIRFIKQETIRDHRARTGRPEGTIFFGSLGSDWESLARDVRNGVEFSARDPRFQVVATNWLSLLRYLSMMQSREAYSDQDSIIFPNVRSRGPMARARFVAKRLRDTGRLSATFKKAADQLPIKMGVDLIAEELHFQIEIDGPTGKHSTGLGIRELAGYVREDDRHGATSVKIFWPGEKFPRSVSLHQAVNEPVSTAPPQHGEIPDSFVIERVVPCGPLLECSESFVQLTTGEFRAFRTSVRHFLRAGFAM